MIQILAWDSAGNVTIGKGRYVYTYQNIYADSLIDIEKILNSKKPNEIWTYLKAFKLTKE